MILISHRGNINRKQPGLENMPEYIDSAIELGYHVEVDVWYKNNEFWLFSYISIFRQRFN